MVNELILLADDEQIITEYEAGHVKIKEKRYSDNQVKVFESFIVGIN